MRKFDTKTYLMTRSATDRQSMSIFHALARYTLISVGLSVAISFGCVRSKSDSADTKVKVTPGLGGVGESVLVSLFKGSGEELGTGTTDATGATLIDIGDYKGPTVMMSRGCDTCTYFQESSGTTVPFTATDTLLSVVPNTVPGGYYSITPVTTMAAQNSGVTATSLKVAGDTHPAQQLAMQQGLTKTYATLGLAGDSIDITAGAPFPTESRPEIDGKEPGAGNAALLASMDQQLAKEGLTSIQAANMFVSCKVVCV